MPHLKDDAAGEQSRALQVPRQRADMRRRLETSRLHPFILQPMGRRLRAVDQRRWLENANFVLVGGGDLARVSAAVERRYPNVVVDRAWDDLYTFECTREDDNVAASCVCLKRFPKIVIIGGEF